jgi:hypothetical protein
VFEGITRLLYYSIFFEEGNYKVTITGIGGCVIRRFSIKILDNKIDFNE